MAAVVCSSVVFCLRESLKLTGADGLFSIALNVLPVLGGFFVASLTIVLTNDHPMLRKEMVGVNKPYIHGDQDAMTRSRYLASLFGYLTFSSFAIFLILSVANLLGPILTFDKTGLAFVIFKLVFCFFVLFWISQVAMAMMIGLYYLSDRLYRADGRAEFKNNNATPAE